MERKSMKRVLLTALLVAVSVLTAWLVAVSVLAGETEQALRQAEEAFHRGEFRAADTLVTSALAANNKETEKRTLIKLHDLGMRIGRLETDVAKQLKHQKAITELHEVGSNEWVSSMFMEALIYRLEDMHKSEGQVLEVLVGQGNIRARTSLIRCLLNQGDKDGAKRQLQSLLDAIESGRLSESGVAVQGLLLMGRPKDALQCLSRSQNRAEYWGFEAEALIHLGRLKKSKSFLEQIGKTRFSDHDSAKPMNPYPLLRLQALVDYELDLPENCLDKIREYSKIGPLGIAMETLRFLCLLRLHRYEEASASLKDSQTILPKVLANRKLEPKYLGVVLREGVGTVRRNQSLARAWYFLAWHDLILGREKRAQLLFEECSKLEYAEGIYVPLAHHRLSLIKKP